MQVKRVYGALNIEFEGRECLSFTIMDRECDSCNYGKCKGCSRAFDPWKEYYELVKYNIDKQEDEKVTYERDQTEAIRMLVKALQEYLDGESPALKRRKEEKEAKRLEAVWKSSFRQGRGKRRYTAKNLEYEA